jgi:hypothetical protein
VAASALVVYLGELPCDVIAAVFDGLPLDAAARLRAVAPSWRFALSGAARWARLDCSAAATRRWAVRASAAAVLGALEAAAAHTSGAGATTLDLTGQPHLDAAFLHDACAREAARVGGGALEALTAPDAVLPPAVAAAICELLPSLRALTVSLAALGSETGASLAAALRAPALRAHAFALAPAGAPHAPLLASAAHAELAAALAPQARWLTRLDLSAARLRDTHVAALAPAVLAAAAALRWLDVSENELSGASTAPLAAALLPSRGGALTHLDVSGNHLGVEGLAALQAALLAQHAHAQAEGKSDSNDSDGECAPLRRLVMQACAPPPAGRAFAAAVEARGATQVAMDWGAHAWRLWGAA